MTRAWAWEHARGMIELLGLLEGRCGVRGGARSGGGSSAQQSSPACGVRLQKWATCLGNRCARSRGLGRFSPGPEIEQGGRVGRLASLTGGGGGRRSWRNPEEGALGLLVPVARRSGTWRCWGTGRRGRSGTGSGESQQALLRRSKARRRRWDVVGLCYGIGMAARGEVGCGRGPGRV